jgi:hypothetical protein
MIKKHLVYILGLALAPLILLTVCYGQSATEAYSQIDVPSYSLSESTALFLPSSESPPNHQKIIFARFAATGEAPQALPLDSVVTVNESEQSISITTNNQATTTKVALITAEQAGVQVATTSQGSLLMEIKPLRETLLTLVVAGGEVRNMFLLSGAAQSASDNIAIPLQPILSLTLSELSKLTQHFERAQASYSGLEESARMVFKATQEFHASNAQQGFDRKLLDNLTATRLQTTTSKALTTIIRLLEAEVRQDLAANNKDGFWQIRRVYSIFTQTLWTERVAYVLSAPSEDQSDAPAGGTQGLSAPGSKPQPQPQAFGASGGSSGGAAGPQGFSNPGSGTAPTATPKIPDTAIPTPIPTSTPNVCPKFWLTAKPDPENSPTEHHIILKWNTFTKAYDYHIRVYRAQKDELGEYIKKQGNYVPEEKPVYDSDEWLNLGFSIRHELKIKVPEPYIYLVKIGERGNPEGGGTLEKQEECELVDVEVPCTTFKEPLAEKEGGSLVAHDLRAGNASRLIVYEVEGELPKLSMFDSKLFFSAEHKACYYAERLVGEQGAEGQMPIGDSDSPMKGFLKKEIINKQGPFKSDLERFEIPSGDHLVCIHLCVYCGSEERFEERIDAKYISAYFQGTTKFDSIKYPAVVPSEKANLFTLTPYFYWSGGSYREDSTWEMQLRAQKNGKLIFNQKGLTEPWFDSTKKIAPADYLFQWRRKDDDDKVTPWSEPTQFTAAIRQPYNILPWEVSYGPTLKLSWTDYGQTEDTRYDILIKPVQGSTTTRYKAKGIKGTSHTVTKQLAYGKYDVEVRRKEGKYKGPWSRVHRIEIKPRTTAISGRSLDSNQRLTVKASLDRNPDEQFDNLRYRFRIWELPSKKKLYDEYSDIRSFTLPVPVTDGQKLLVAARPYDSDKNPITKWSKKEKLTVDLSPPPPIPVFTEPVGSFMYQDDYFAWLEIPNADRYEIKIINLEDNTELANTEITEPFYRHIQPLPGDTEVEVVARAHTNDGWQQWCLPETFYVRGARRYPNDGGEEG